MTCSIVSLFAGDFDSITAPALAGGNTWDFRSLKTTGSVTVVREPGIGALLGLRRRRSIRTPFEDQYDEAKSA